jgi:hypothetical protein
MSPTGDESAQASVTIIRERIHSPGASSLAIYHDFFSPSFGSPKSFRHDQNNLSCHLEHGRHRFYYLNIDNWSAASARTDPNCEERSSHNELPQVARTVSSMARSTFLP